MEALRGRHRPSGGASGHRFLRARRRVRIDRRPVRLREIDPPQDPRRPAAGLRRRCPFARQADRRPAPRHRRRVPVASAVPVAQRLRQRAPARRRAAARARADTAARLRALGPRRSQGLRAPLPVAAVGRHAAAGRARARPHPRSRAPPDGRALRRARRADPRDHERRAAAHLARAAQDRRLHHPFDLGGGVPRRPRPRHDAAAGPDPGRSRDRSAAPAKPRGDEHRGVRGVCSAHPKGAQRRRRPRMTSGLRGLALRLLCVLAVLAVWELLVRALSIPAYILPPPTAILTALYRGMVSTLYIEHIWITLTETLLGFMVVNAALVAFFPLMVNTIVGLRSAEEDRINLMRSLASTPLQIFCMLQLPNALPYIFAGLEIAMIFALIGAIVAEFVGAQAGLGML